MQHSTQIVTISLSHTIASYQAQGDKDAIYDPLQMRANVSQGS